MTEDESLGARIRRLRLERGLTQRELAEPRYTRAFLAAIEAGVRVPNAETLAHVAGTLGVDPDDLRHGRPADAATTLAGVLAEARRELSRGRTAEAAAKAADVERLARRYALPELQCRAVHLSGDVALHTGDVGAALGRYTTAKTLLDAEQVTLRAAVVAREAYCLQITGATGEAITLLETELRGVRAATDPDPDAQIRLTSALVYTFLELDWRERARRLEREALPLLPRVRNREWLAQFSVTVAQLRRDHDLADTERLLGEALAIYTDLGLTREIGICQWAHGYVLRRVGRVGEAAERFERARAILLEVGAVQDVAGATLELAEARRLAGDLDEAERLATEAAGICHRTQHQECMAEADRLLGRIAGTRTPGDPIADQLLSRAADRYEESGLTAELVTTSRLLGEQRRAGGNVEGAAESFRRGLLAAAGLPGLLVTPCE
ncbi:helix-turn-helix transcriptional regulator [Dactylosporangium aurantiacum]|uniref:Helix-turn-helix transcriptional regulator n=1 Tax=Dactylosporangium aurantiacum TaxID=35754 RepID=A0A9Q9IKD5_9ACTN|nr:helix-turn-helix transcriptional regulator [Dactylosporangium aurantiacum]MDG6107474.1 helix-turn-helix transcriptional regulator [Dactylosporangium aurantiacum]UWZ54405.1 helix-turn-helix transcriptional regulator [Dactylosporangium aurantiacum]